MMLDHPDDCVCLVGWANDDDNMMASDSEDEGVAMQLQHTMVSSSHKGLGLKTVGAKRGKSSYTEEDEDESLDGTSDKKKRKA
jgi:hypothetical protein